MLEKYKLTNEQIQEWVDNRFGLPNTVNIQVYREFQEAVIERIEDNLKFLDKEKVIAVLSQPIKVRIDQETGEHILESTIIKMADEIYNLPYEKNKSMRVAVFVRDNKVSLKIDGVEIKHCNECPKHGCYTESDTGRADCSCRLSALVSDLRHNKGIPKDCPLSGNRLVLDQSDILVEP